MFTQGFAEVISDVLTINPALRQIASASAILDASNYTFQAVTFGKDAEGFKYHAHIIHSSATPINYNHLYVSAINTDSPYSYHSSSVHALYSSTYNSVPCYPSVLDTRLERKSTITNLEVSALDTNQGHYVNVALLNGISGVPSGAWTVIGGFAPSGTSNYRFINDSAAEDSSGTLSSLFNSSSLMDVNGYLRFNTLNASAGSSGTGLSGAYLSGTASSFGVVTYIAGGDRATMAAFGGLNHIGLYCFDIKRMLAAGLQPPYSWNTDGRLKFKLVNKTTFWNDLLIQYDDSGGDAGFANLILNPMTIVIGLNFLQSTSPEIDEGPIVYSITLSGEHPSGPLEDLLE